MNDLLIIITNQQQRKQQFIPLLIINSLNIVLLSFPLQMHSNLTLLAKVLLAIKAVKLHFPGFALFAQYNHTMILFQQKPLQILKIDFEVIFEILLNIQFRIAILALNNH